MASQVGKIIGPQYIKELKYFYFYVNFYNIMSFLLFQQLIYDFLSECYNHLNF